MVPGQKFLIHVRQVASAIFGLGLENFPLKILLVKKNPIGSGQKVPRLKTGRPLIHYKSKVCLGWVRAHLYLAYMHTLALPS